ncbi:hypothetical protein CCUG60885_04224 [Mycobacteroides salmoniphilum]|uniref:Uncharacterized protein n=1 Tax=Mycobacteroides salmoniphilum TaxID=404941 RepID=A0A4R8SBY3_9MYCO|nr:hypothetical protein CCUG60885_04224 [Mycobacteroides salmoniphilum]TEA07340.1 hypothetical protein CCUG60883_01373 [Mycobacteroides salmoniphilum]
MTTQAIQDIKELVGEMPARGCEWPDDDCGAQARWIAVVHEWLQESQSCRRVVLDLCDQHKNALVDQADYCVSPLARLLFPTCPCCYVDLRNASNIVGPVMPL